MHSALDRALRPMSTMHETAMMVARPAFMTTAPAVMSAGLARARPACTSANPASITAVAPRASGRGLSHAGLSVAVRATASAAQLDETVASSRAMPYTTAMRGKMNWLSSQVPRNSRLSATKQRSHRELTSSAANP